MVTVLICKSWLVQLREREDKRRQQKRDEAIAMKPSGLLDTGDAKGALTMIQSVPSEDLRSSDEPLRRQLEEIVTAEDELTALVQESKADGVLDPDEVALMWQATVSYLKLNHVMKRSLDFSSNWKPGFRKPLGSMQLSLSLQTCG